MPQWTKEFDTKPDNLSLIPWNPRGRREVTTVRCESGGLTWGLTQAKPVVCHPEHQLFYFFFLTITCAYMGELALSFHLMGSEDYALAW